MGVWGGALSSRPRRWVLSPGTVGSYGKVRHSELSVRDGVLAVESPPPAPPLG